MRIAVIINNLGFGGAERLAVDEVNELYRRGVPVVLITLRPERKAGSFTDLCILPTEQRRYIPIHSVYDVRGYVVLASFLHREKFSVVVSHLWFANAIARAAAFLARIPVRISFEHNVYDNVKTKRQFFLDRILQRLSTRIVAVSQAVRESLIIHNIDARRIVVIENGIDLNRFHDVVPSNVRREKNLGDTFLFLFVGRLIHQKGVDILLNAFARVADAHLLIAGDGVERAALEERSHALGIDSRVTFLGARDDIPALMKTVDCFVLPSRWEGVGIVLFEAMASGLPIIVSDFGAAREVVNDGVSGLIVPIGDVDSLVRAMNRMNTDPQLRFRLLHAGETEITRFSITRHVDTLLRSVAESSGHDSFNSADS